MAKTITKTYGVYDMIEYEVTLNIGGKMVKASFGGGSITSYGITPATYRTSNPVVQYVMEQCNSYKRGVIKLVKTEESGEDAPSKTEGNTQPIKSAGTAAVAQERIQEEAKAEVKAGKKVVEVSCLADAVEYLRTKGYKSQELRSKAAIEKAGAEQGVEFVVKA